MLDSEQIVIEDAQTLFSVLTSLDSGEEKKQYSTIFQTLFVLAERTLLAGSPGIAVKRVRHPMRTCFHHEDERG